MEEDGSSPRLRCPPTWSWPTAASDWWTRHTRQDTDWTVVEQAKHEDLGSHRSRGRGRFWTPPGWTWCGWRPRPSCRSHGWNSTNKIGSKR